MAQDRRPAGAEDSCETETVVKRSELLGKVHSTSPCYIFSEVMDAIETWESLRDDFYECGGQQLHDEDQCTNIMEILPPDPETPSTLLAALEGYVGDPEGLKQKIDKQITLLQEHSRRLGRANLAQADGSNDGEDLGEHASSAGGRTNDGNVVDLTCYEESEQAGILAFMRASGDKRPVRTGAFRVRGPGRGNQTTRPRAQTPPKDGSARGPKCGNCACDHTTRECPKPQLSAAERPCFDCGKPGHTQVDCPEGKKKPGRGGGAGAKAKINLVDGSGNDVIHAMMMTDAEGFQLVGRKPVDLAPFRWSRAGGSQK